MPSGIYVHKPHTVQRKNNISKALKGCVAWNKNKRCPQLSAALMGHPVSTKTRLKMSQKAKQRTEELHGGWKGDDVGYNALHSWVKKHLGFPNTCEHCGKTNLTGRYIHWANKSKKYKRELNDWIRLCAKCHWDYDRR